MASIVAFRQTHKFQNWTNEELAELFRVVDILSRAGVQIDTDMGLSDEGDPWFAFCRADTGDVIVHFSRIDGQFVAVSAATDSVMRGNNFRRVAEALVSRQPLILPPAASGQKLFLHPSVILTALVATTLAQMKSWEGQDIETFDDSASSGSDISQASFSETLKTAFLDALNIVLRGFSGPLDTKHALAEHSQSTGLGLGLGNLSLASVVAFAFSVIQGTLLQDETAVAQESTGAADGTPKITAVAAEAQAATDQGTQPQANAPEQPVAGSEPAPVKTAQHETGLIAAAKIAEPSDKSTTSVSSNESVARNAHQELADRLAPDTARDGVALQKNVAAQAGAHAPKAPPVVQAQATADQKEAAAFLVVRLDATAEHHRITFTEISKQALEIFFGDSSGITGISISAGRGGEISPGNVFAGILDATKIIGPEPGPSFDLFVPSVETHRPLNASDIVFAGGDPVALARLNLITSFVNSPNSLITGQVAFQDSLRPFWAGDKAVTVVIFDSQNLPLNIFSFTNDVLFVEDSQLAGTALDFGNRSLHLELANGGDVTLLGVLNLSPVIEAA